MAASGGVSARMAALIPQSGAVLSSCDRCLCRLGDSAAACGQLAHHVLVCMAVCEP